MHLLLLMSLPLLAFCASFEGFSDPTGDHTTSAYSDISPARAVYDPDGEERSGLSVPVAEKVKTVFSSSKITQDHLQKWLDKGKPADVVFARMRLSKAGGWLFYCDDFTRWLKYVDDLRSKNPAKETSAIATLTAHYGDAKLYKLIDEATKVTRMKELATELQTKQMKHWVSVAKDPDDVFHFMELDKVKEHILSNPKFDTWAKYVDDFSAKYPKKRGVHGPDALE